MTGKAFVTLRAVYIKMKVCILGKSKGQIIIAIVSHAARLHSHTKGVPHYIF